VHPVECDLNELLRDFLRAEVKSSGVEVQTEFRPLPKMRVDPEQMRKVVTNLLINAREAVSVGGQIRLETNRQNNWAVLAVSDNGCGMAADFVQQNLFRPFQTTKKRGIGIGMFHCKMIVEAHQGRIEVESEQGKGTCFRVLLPILA
jgi:signal transduction histidine kinase